MSAADQTRVTVSVTAPPALAFEVFTREIDLWWRRGLKYRHFGGDRALVAIEPFEGGRVFESEGGEGPVHEIGRVMEWAPPTRLRFEWRLANFAPHERTEVEVRFEPAGDGKWVTVIHRGWAAICDDHPARHGDTSSAFLRRLGLWWADQLTVFMLTAAAPSSRSTS